MKKPRNQFGLVRLLFVAAFAFAAGTVSAQEITGSIEGTVLTPDGQPAVGVTAVVTDSRDGRSQSVSSDSNGLIAIRSMSPGGPYTIRITGEGYADLMITDMYTSVAGTSSFTVALEAAGGSIEEVVVTAAQIQTVVTASGPSSTFSLATINDMPSTTRQIRDTIRLDPRVSIGETGDGGDQSGAISCLGGSSRTNSFTVDGVRANDAFGLNLSGNLSRFTFPIPFDTVDAAAVEFSPVSVEYGQFSGCNVNVVTKSGTNEFHGGGFYLYNDDGMTNDKIDGASFEQGTFERENYGVDIGGPIIKDKLFFYAAYEKFTTASTNPVGSADDTSFPRNDTIFTTAELDRIRNILINNYDRDPGFAVRNLPIESEREFIRLDWNINENHRMEGTFSTVEEASLIRDDIGGGRGEYTFSDNFHARGSESETLALRLFSDWTDRLSTEVRWSTQEVTDLQNPLGGGEAQDPVPKPRIALGNGSIFGEFTGQEFVSGPGTFRSANKLATTKDQFKIKMDYQVGDHLITAGYEFETLDVFNLFIINGTGTVFFTGADSTEMIDNLEAGTAAYINQGVSFTGDPNDAAAAYKRDIHSYYLQDAWNITDSTELIFGVRIDEYKSDDLPLENPNYVARYGFTNQVGMDGLDAVQPRIGLNHTLDDKWGDTRISLGFGVFSGNDPTVWFSNAYQNFGGALGVGDTGTFRSGSSIPNPCDGSELNVLPGGPGSFTGIPPCVVASGQNQANEIAGAVNSTDPNFELPTAHRWSFGVEHNTGGDGFFADWNIRFDYIYAELKDQVAWVDLSLSPNGTLPDGRPTFEQVDPLLPNCNATFIGPRQGFANVTPDCLGGQRDIMFTNQPGDGGSTETVSIQLAKMFEWGSGWSLNLSTGYSYNDSEIGNPGSAFTATSSHDSVVFIENNLAPIGPSFRNNPHNFVLAGTFAKNIFGDNRSSLSFFFNRRKGQPISVVYFGDEYNDAVGDTSGDARYLLYVPVDENDPLVQWADPAEAADFFAYTDKKGLKRGAIAPKGAVDEAWQSDLDIRIQQEIPLFGDAKGLIYFDIENVLNLIDDSWGVKDYTLTTDIISAVGLVDAEVVDDGNGGEIFEYSNFTRPQTRPDQFDSLYRIQLGLRFSF